MLSQPDKVQQQMILNCVMIGPDRNLAIELQTAFNDLGGINIIREFTQYPHEFELLRSIRSLGPHVVFLGLSDPERSNEIIQALNAEFPTLQVAVFHDEVEPKLLLKLMKSGIREYIAPPFDPDELAEVLIRLRDAALKNPLTTPRSNLVYSFLPSKPGSGTTTLATNVSLAMARQPDTTAMLMDLDLNSGLIRFLLKLENEYTILDAAQHASNMDEALWPSLVSSLGKLDVLHAGKISPGVRIENDQIRNLIDYARKNYTAICVDLSGNMEKYSTEVMQESKKIFVVCTPEIPSLHLAREKFNYLKDTGLSDKVSFLLNRQSKTDILETNQIENILGDKIYMHFANDYRGVTTAVAEGKAISQASELGKQLTKFSYFLLERPIPSSVQNAKTKKEMRSFMDLLRYGFSRFISTSDSASKA